MGQILKTKYKFVNTLEGGVRFLTQIDQLPSEDKLLQRLEDIRRDFISATN